MSMQWKKHSQTGHSQKSSRGNINVSLSAHDKQTKRRKQSKHKKMLTQGAAPFAINHRSTLDHHSPLSKIRQDQTTFSSQPSHSYGHSQSATHSNGVFGSIEQFAQDFQKENERIRSFIKQLEERNTKQSRDCKLGGKKEGLGNKIKKQNIMLKASFSPKGLK